VVVLRTSQKRPFNKIFIIFTHSITQLFDILDKYILFLVMESIRTFVKKTLGCRCPEEVFEDIECQANIFLDNILVTNKIYIGKKLLIYIVELSDSDGLKETLKSLVVKGKKERDRMWLNRFRLVLAVEDPRTVGKHAFAVFDILEKDERVHLHVVHKEEIKELGAK